MFKLWFLLAILHTWTPTAVAATDREVTCLLRMAEAEARGEGRKGVLLVAQTALNRARELKRDVCRVISERSQFASLRRASKAFREKYETELWLLASGLHPYAHAYADVWFFHRKELHPPHVRGKKHIETYGNHSFYGR